MSAGSAIGTLRRFPNPGTGPARHNALWCIRAGREDYGIGEMGADEKAANCLILWMRLAPISPLEGEMSRSDRGGYDSRKAGISREVGSSPPSVRSGHLPLKGEIGARGCFQRMSLTDATLIG